MQCFANKIHVAPSMILYCYDIRSVITSIVTTTFKMLWFSSVYWRYTYCILYIIRNSSVISVNQTSRPDLKNGLGSSAWQYIAEHLLFIPIISGKQRRSFYGINRMLVLMRRSIRFIMQICDNKHFVVCTGSAHADISKISILSSLANWPPRLQAGYGLLHQRNVSWLPSISQNVSRLALGTYNVYASNSPYRFTEKLHLRPIKETQTFERPLKAFGQWSESFGFVKNTSALS